MTRNASRGNNWYAGGTGDFVVYPDKNTQFFYVYFANYTTSVPEQGLCVARISYKNRKDPVGKAQRWYNGAWSEPGLAGHSTPIFPASADIFLREAQTFWGPVIHWNTHLQRYVMILNRIRDTTWATESI